MLRCNFFFLLTAFAATTGCVSQPLPSSGTTTVRSSELGSSLCGAHAVTIMPGGGSILLRDQTTFPRTQLTITFQGFVYHVVWSNRLKPDSARRVGTTMKSVAPISSNEFVSVGFQNHLTVKSVSSELATNSEVDIDLAASLGRHSYITVSGFSPTASKLRHLRDSLLRPPINQDLSIQEEFQAASSQTEARFQKTNTDNGLLARLIFEGESYWVGSENGTNLALKMPNGEVQELPDQLDMYSFTDLSLARLPNGTLALVAQGLEVPLVSETNTKVKEFGLYSTPIIDASSGYLVWRFGPNNIEKVSKLPSKLFEVSKLEVSKWLEKGWILKSVSVDSKTNKVAMIFRQIGGRFNTYPRDNVALVLLNGRDAEYWQCKQTDVLEVSEPRSWETADVTQTAIQINQIPGAEFKLKFDELLSQDKSYRLAKWSIYPARERGILVQLRGGPATNIYHQQLNQLDKFALANGWRIIRYDYSGTTNASLNLSSRLSLDIQSALSQDGELIAQDLATQSTSIPVVIQATSFGARLAPFIEAKVGRRINGYIMQVPFTFWRPPNQTKPFAEWSDFEKSQLQFDTVTYGAPISSNGLNFNNWSRNVTLGFCKVSNATYFFGERDPRVRLEDWTDVCGDQLVAKVYSNEGHGVIDNPQFIKDASRKLEEVLLNFQNSHDPLPPRRHRRPTPPCLWRRHPAPTCPPRCLHHRRRHQREHWHGFPRARSICA